MIIGMLGAGQMAQTLARSWLPAGHQVLLANSRGPETLADLIADLGDGAAAATARELADTEVIVLATRWEQTPAALAAVGSLAGRIVVDATNNRLGPPLNDIIDLGGRTSSEVIADLVPGARVVKAFNHMPIPWLATLRERPEPAALYVAGDDPAAKAVVGSLIQDLGAVPVDTGSLVDGGHLYGTGGGRLTGRGRPFTVAEAQAVLADLAAERAI